MTKLSPPKAFDLDLEQHANITAHMLDNDAKHKAAQINAAGLPKRQPLQP